MLRAFHNKTVNIMIPVLLFCFIFSSGCVTSGIQTIESDDLESDHKYITDIINITLKSGETFSGNDYNFSLALNDRNGAKIYLYPKPKYDTLKVTSKIYQYESFSLTNILSAKVRYKNKPTVTGYIAGGVVLIGLLAFLWWANGERNKRP